MERLQEEVQLYKVMKYQQGYRAGTQGKTLRYPRRQGATTGSETPRMRANESTTPADAPNVATEADAGKERP